MRRRDWKSLPRPSENGVANSPITCAVGSLILLTHTDICVWASSITIRSIRPFAACQRLRWQSGTGCWVVAPVVGHQYRVRRQPVAVPTALVCSISVRRSQIKMARLPFAAPRGCSQSQEGLSGPCRSHQHLASMPISSACLPPRCASSWGMAGRRECGRRVLRRIVKKAVRRHAATFSHFDL